MSLSLVFPCFSIFKTKYASLVNFCKNDWLFCDIHNWPRVPMEQINSSVVRNSIFALIWMGVPQAINNLKQKKFDKNIQTVDSNVELCKKEDKFSKNSKNLDCLDIKTWAISSENGESCNKPEIKSNEPNLEDYIFLDFVKNRIAQHLNGDT